LLALRPFFPCSQSLMNGLSLLSNIIIDNFRGLFPLFLSLLDHINYRSLVCLALLLVFSFVQSGGHAIQIFSALIFKQGRAHLFFLKLVERGSNRIIINLDTEVPIFRLLLIFCLLLLLIVLIVYTFYDWWVKQFLKFTLIIFLPIILLWWVVILNSLRVKIH